MFRPNSHHGECSPRARGRSAVRLGYWLILRLPAPVPAFSPATNSRLHPHVVQQRFRGFEPKDGSSREQVTAPWSRLAGLATVARK